MTKIYIIQSFKMSEEHPELIERQSLNCISLLKDEAKITLQILRAGRNYDYCEAMVMEDDEIIKKKVIYFND